MRKPKHSSVVAIFTILLMLVAIFSCNIILVSGDSMNPTYKDGDVLLAIKSQSFVKNDIVIFKLDNEVFIKRVYAVAGDTVEIISHEIYINGIKLSQYTSDQNDCVFELRHGEYYLLGDNCNDSIDSRYFGVIKGDQIIAKVIAKIYSVNAWIYTKE